MRLQDLWGNRDRPGARGAERHWAGDRCVSRSADPGYPQHPPHLCAAERTRSRRLGSPHSAKAERQCEATGGAREEPDHRALGPAGQLRILHKRARQDRPGISSLFCDPGTEQDHLKASWPQQPPHVRQRCTVLLNPRPPRWRLCGPLAGECAAQSSFPGRRRLLPQGGNLSKKAGADATPGVLERQAFPLAAGIIAALSERAQQMHPPSNAAFTTADPRADGQADSIRGGRAGRRVCTPALLAVFGRTRGCASEWILSKQECGCKCCWGDRSCTFLWSRLWSARQWVPRVTRCAARRMRRRAVFGPCMRLRVQTRSWILRVGNRPSSQGGMHWLW
ncbi:uncharacterized protein LOC115069529 [Nannospalax galili]|uniref:uncharacterized protein LOC115069529 n=1 Tax=Nannospalax galili TaxID=1026970 RepID=UPI00111C0E18|nr:uncharacterized protein LOC115069529 [Nannospalax galili]